MKIKKGNWKRKVKIKDLVKDNKNINSLILSNILNLNRSDLILNYEKELTKAELKKYYKYQKKYQKGIPIQYILKETYFYDKKYYVSKNVLIPRPETELLVGETIKLIKEKFPKKVKILDVGTGSGVIAITLKSLLNTSSVTATDISKKALKVAKLNAQYNKQKIEFINTDLLNKVTGKYDVLISNPPYIPYNSKLINKDVKKYEPKKALFAKDDGLYFYKRILKESQDKLNKKNIIALEIEQTKKEEIKKIVTNIYPCARIITKQDLNGFDRYIFVINGEKYANRRRITKRK